MAESGSGWGWGLGAGAGGWGWTVGFHFYITESGFGRACEVERRSKLLANLRKIEGDFENLPTDGKSWKS